MVLSFCALLVAFSSATQDVAIDAYRIEAVDEEFQGAMSATYIFGYRLALLAAGAGALYLAEYFDWSFAYQAMACLLILGVVTVLLIDEPLNNRDQLFSDQPQAWLPRFIKAVVDPFTEFFVRNGQFALIILLFIAVSEFCDGNVFPCPP